MRLVEVAGASILIPQFPVESSLLLRFSVCSGDVGQDKVHSELGISHPKGMSTFGRRLWHFRSIALLPPACNNPPMNFCVVIPAKDEHLGIGKTVRSVLAAGALSKNIYVVDDGSRDNTSDIARSSGVNVMRNEKN